MTLRGKYFCNCEHAQMLITAVEDALARVENGEYFSAKVRLAEAVEAHQVAHAEYCELEADHG